MFGGGGMGRGEYGVLEPKTNKQKQSLVSQICYNQLTVKVCWLYFYESLLANLPSYYYYSHLRLDLQYLNLSLLKKVY